MKITGLSVESTLDGHQELTVRARLASGEELEEGDLTRILGIIREAAGETDSASLKAPAEAPTRRRRGGGEASTAENTPSTPTTAEAPARRRRGAAAEPQAAPEPASAEEPPRRRRRGSPEPAAATGISDEDLLMACTAAAEYLTPAGVKQVMQEDHGVTDVKNIPQDQRVKFMLTLDAEVEAEKADTDKKG